jgi:hypothetical protein
MDKLIAQHFTQSDIEGISKKVHCAYRAIDHLYAEHPLLGNFMPAADIRPNLINVAVQFELTKLSNDGFNYKIEKNAARNCNHVQLIKNDIRLTVHYLGHKKPRSKARYAICREPLAALNEDLFDFFGNKEEIKSLNCSYFHIYHWGFKTPDKVILALPDSEQKRIMGRLILPKMKLTQEEEKIEEIKETIEHTLKEVSNNEYQQNNKEANG